MTDLTIVNVETRLVTITRVEKGGYPFAEVHRYEEQGLPVFDVYLLDEVVTEDGDAENGPHVSVDYVPRLVASGVGGEDPLDLVKRALVEAQEDCCPFHRAGGTRELVCGGDLPSFEGRHSRGCAVQGGGDCTCQTVAAEDQWDGLEDFERERLVG